MKTADFDYVLPPERIAQTPLEPRHSFTPAGARPGRRYPDHRTFWEIGDFLKPGDLLVLNQTRVIKARIFARKETGGRVELLLLNRRSETTWEALVGGKGVKAGRRLTLEDGPGVEIVEELEGSRRVVNFAEPVEPYLEAHGQMPLPPYIHERLEDPERYQTVYARETRFGGRPDRRAAFHARADREAQGAGDRFRLSDPACRAGYLCAGHRGGSGGTCHPHRVVRVER